MPVISLNLGSCWIIASAYGCWLNAILILAPEACFQSNLLSSARTDVAARIAAERDATKNATSGERTLICVFLKIENPELIEEGSPKTHQTGCAPSRSIVCQGEVEEERSLQRTIALPLS